MKRLVLMGASLAVFAGAVVYGSTGAFFSDSETSTGNTFTAGAIDLTVDSTQHYNNAVCVLNTSTEQITNDYWWQLAPNQNAAVNQYPVIGSACDGSWGATNLGAQKFFNFSDIKPGDQGENTISLHVDNNDAYACVDVAITKNDDVSSNEPELGAGDVQEDVNNNFDGELAQNLNFFAWADIASTNGAVPGDNIWQVGEPALFTNGVGPASDALNGKHYTLADSNTGPLVGGVTKYIGIAWCAGTMTANAGVITCNGASMDNKVQTDSMTADISFRVEQARNNPNFTCAPAAATTLTLEKVIQQDGIDVVNESLWTLTATGPVVISGVEQAPAVTAAPVPAGDYVLTENSVQGFSQVGIQCVGGTLNGNTVTVAQGANVVCTFTNSEDNQQG